MILFHSEHHAAVALAGLFLLAGTASAAAPQTAPAARAAPSRPSLVLITAEGLRPDRLGCYHGTDAVATPNIDSLAAEGRLFEQVLTSSVSSLPATASLLTGRTPYQTGVWEDHYRNRLSASTPTLATRLRKEGYRTGAFVATSRFAAGRGFDQGFDLFQDGYNPVPSGVWRLVNRPGDKVVPGAVSWLQGPEAPFFLWIHLIDPAIPAPPNKTEAPTDAVDAAYYAKRITALDARVGEIVKALKDRGSYDGTVVALTSDHGMSLGEHGESRSGVFLYEASVRVPLVIKTLAGDPKKGSRSADLAGLVDLFPTLERLLKLPQTPGLPGRDLLAPAAGSPAYASFALLPQEIFGWRGQQLIARGSRRLISGTGTELYDVASDPGEMKDLSATSASEAASLREEGRKLAAGAEVPRPHYQPDKGLPADMAARLVKMGYASPSPGNARSRELPDPRRFLPSMRMLEFAQIFLDLGGLGMVKDVRERLLKEDAEGLFTQMSAVQIDLGQAETVGGDIAPVKTLLKNVQKIYPLEGEVYHQLGHAAFDEKKYADAELFVKAAQALSPLHPSEISYDLACAYARQGKKEQAIAELGRSIGLGYRDSRHIASDPDLESLRQDPAFKRLMEVQFPSSTPSASVPK